MHSETYSKIAHDQGWEWWIPNPFGIPHAIKKETGKEGKCQFTSISESIYPIHVYSASHLRSLAAREMRRMPREEFEVILCSYRLEKEHGEFKGKWDPNKIKSRSELADILTQPNRSGDHWMFAGDNTTLVLLANALKIRILVLEEFRDQGIKKPHVVVCEPKSGKAILSILLWYDRLAGHYQSVGVVRPELEDAPKETIFYNQHLPDVLQTYIG
jgi:hypothetical protein